MGYLCDACHNVKGMDIPATHKRVAVLNYSVDPSFLIFNCCEYHGLEPDIRVPVDTTYQEIEALVEVKRALEE